MKNAAQNNKYAVTFRLIAAILLLSVFCNCLPSIGYCYPGKRTYTRADIEKEKLMADSENAAGNEEEIMENVESHKDIPNQKERNEIEQYRMQVREEKVKIENRSDLIPVKKEDISESKRDLINMLGIDVPVT